MVNPFERNDLHASRETREQPHQANQNRKRGRPRIDYAPTKSPTMYDIHGMAKWFDGEGNVTINNNQIEINFGQNDRETIDKYRELFGGRVYGPYKNSVGNNTHVYKIVRERALGLMFTIFTMLPRARKDQFIAVLNGQVIKRVYEKVITNEGISESYLMRNLERSIKRQEKARKRNKHPMSLFGMKR